MNNALQILLIGDTLMIVCCIFYLLWWGFAFRPKNPIKGFKSGWLLLPAAAAGIASVFVLVNGMKVPEGSPSLYSDIVLVGIGIAVYIILAIVSSTYMHRQITTELILIVGWTILALMEINTLYGLLIVSMTAAIILIVCAVIFAAVSLICYQKYYDLDAEKGFIDGMVPLILVGIFMIILTFIILFH